jgi:hypothetical protein
LNLPSAHADWWKKYSVPSGAARNPKPLSLINRLIVPLSAAIFDSCPTSIDETIQGQKLATAERPISRAEVRSSAAFPSVRRVMTEVIRF